MACVLTEELDARRHVHHPQVGVLPTRQEPVPRTAEGHAVHDTNVVWNRKPAFTCSVIRLLQGSEKVVGDHNLVFQSHILLY